mmetsp:Transcript_11077/g.24013  ORF Transcript_11077/g.24013 Transcript_11077/m.24013 type:complete len:364 (+) Transcript_11077:308-1399(+)
MASTSFVHPSRRRPLDVHAPPQHVQAQSAPAAHPRKLLLTALQVVSLVPLVGAAALLPLVPRLVIDLEERGVQFRGEPAGLDRLARDDSRSVRRSRGGHVEYHLNPGRAPDDGPPFHLHLSAVHSVTPQAPGLDPISQLRLNNGVVLHPVEAVPVDGIGPDVEVVGRHQGQASDHPRAAEAGVEPPLGDDRRRQVGEESREAQEHPGDSVRSHGPARDESVELHLGRHDALEGPNDDAVAVADAVFRLLLLFFLRIRRRREEANVVSNRHGGRRRATTTIAAAVAAHRHRPLHLPGGDEDDARPDEGDRRRERRDPSRGNDADGVSSVARQRPQQRAARRRAGPHRFGGRDQCHHCSTLSRGW